MVLRTAATDLDPLQEAAGTVRLSSLQISPVCETGDSFAPRPT
jgi:hypothetical protein